MREMILAGALALAACSPAAQQTAEAPGETASVRGCQAVATKPWRPLSGTEFTVEAFSNGPDCEHAVGTIVVRNVQGDVLWAEASPTAHIMVLAGARDADAMQAGLSEWVTVENTTMATTSALPDWPANANAPVSGEFPFYPESELDRDSYLGLRQANVPLLCYVQGMESLACLALRDGQLERVGVQTFPG